MARRDADKPKGAIENAAIGGVAAAAYVGFIALAYVSGSPRIAVEATGEGALAAPSAIGSPERALAGSTPPDGTLRPATASAVSIESADLAPPDLIDPSGGRPAAVNPHLEFLVKMSGEDVTALRDSFLENPNEARKRFKAIARDRAAFRDLRLKRMTYGGELTLEWVGAPPKDAAAADAISTAVIDRLKSAPGVVYAEPNLVGWKEKTQP